MIIVKLMGGLGNQMFQLAAGKALALRHGVELKADPSWLNKDAGGKYTQRHYELGIFRSEIAIAEEQDLQAYTKTESLLKRALKKYKLSSSGYARMSEGIPGYDPAFESYPANTYLDGYWQSELYFKNYEKEIRELFQFRESIKEACRPLVQKIERMNAVSLHVRRGDYVENAEAGSFHGLCSPAYYEAAVKRIAELHGAPELIVFSDDVAWCKQHLNFPLPIHFFETGSAAEDLYLMSRCKHHIIANSSFSWWGAWLNDTKQKTVIAPKTWFAGADDKHIIPSTWIRL